MCRQGVVAMFTDDSSLVEEVLVYCAFCLSVTDYPKMEGLKELPFHLLVIGALL